MYGGPAVYCQAVVGDFLQFTKLCCSCHNLSCRGELLVLLPDFWGNGQEFVLGDEDRDVQGTVDNFAGNGGVFNGGGVAVLGPGVSGAVVFLTVRAVMAGVVTVVVLGGVAGPVTLVLVSLATPA
jgi:hypothetical protein